MAIIALAASAVAYAQPTLNSIYPDGTVQFQPTNVLAFNIGSAVGITSLTVQLSGTNLTGTGTTQLLTNGSGLTVTGPATSETATAVLSNNIVYTAVIQAADAGGPTTTTVVFDTITPSYTWEAEDFDYTNGLYFDNPQTNAYDGLVATVNVDGYNPNNPSGGGAGLTYRPTPATGASGNLGVENVSDIPRAAYVGTGQTDYDQGWNNGGSGLWGNYTRHFPAGRWNIFMRGAGWQANSTESALMYQGGINGTLLGQYIVPNTGAGHANIYQNYTWVPLGDIAGNPIEWDTDGSQQTLTIQAIQGNYNANFYMLMPIDTNFHPRPFASNVYPNGSTVMFPGTNVFSFIANSVAGLQTSNVVLTLNGVVPYGITISGSPHF